MSKIGFFGGSFNPPTIAHMELALDAIKNKKLDKVVFVPVGDYYEKRDLINESHRYNMLKEMTKGINNLNVSDIELNRNEKLYAIDIFKIITEQYINDEIYFIMGADNFKSILEWKDGVSLIQNYKYIIITRKDSDIRNIIEKEPLLKENKDNFYILNNEEYLNMSSTEVRDLIRKNKDIDKYVEKKVKDYINNNNLYRGE